MPARLRVSAVIPAYQRTDLLVKAARSALQQDLAPGEFEVIVVDSSPDDANANAMAELAAGSGGVLRFFRKPAEGPGPSRNLGARAGSGPFIAFLDSDCEASPQWLRAGLAAFSDDVGLVQGRTLPTPGAPHSVFNRSLTVQSESFVYETANMFYRRVAFEAVGGFPPDLHPQALLPMGGEDTELAWKVKRAGWQSRFAPEALVTHAVHRREAWRWFYDKPLFILPHLVSRYPELRQFFYARFFFDRIHAALSLAIAGAALAPLQPAALLLAMPYFVSRAREPSLTLRGPRRLLRPLLYLPRDLVSFGLLLAGSVRFGALLL